MSKFYAVELKIVVIVQVNDDQDMFDAELIAEDEQLDIMNDARNNSVEFECVGEIKSTSDLEQYGWDKLCLPYGGDGNSSLEDLLPSE